MIGFHIQTISTNKGRTDGYFMKLLKVNKINHRHRGCSGAFRAYFRYQQTWAI